MEVDREWRRLEMQSIPEDTLDYVEDQGMDDDNNNEANDEDQLENKKTFARYRGNDGNFNVEGNYDDDDTNNNSPGEWDGGKKEEKIAFNFEEEMGKLCKCMASTHGHNVEERLRTNRIIRAFHKKKEWLNLRA